jgi:hypothetical protein
VSALGFQLALSACSDCVRLSQLPVCLRPQIPVECPPGTTYGRYFHLLLHTRGLLLLGVYRHVPAGGPHFRAVITNPSYVSQLIAQTYVSAYTRTRLKHVLCFEH